MATTPRWVSQRRMICATRFLVFPGERNQQLVLENVVLAFGKRPPGFNLHPVLQQKLLGFNLLVERMGFDLVHGRRHLVMAYHVHDPVGWEVAEADGADPTFTIQFFHRSPGAIHIPKGLVDQVQIQSIEL